MKYKPNLHLCAALAAVFGLHSSYLQASDSVQLRVVDGDRADLVVQAEVDLVVGQAKLSNDYALISLQTPEQIREAAAGSGIVGSDHGQTDTKETSWGYAEIVFHCGTADVAVYQYDVFGVAQAYSAGTYESNYCPPR